MRILRAVTLAFAVAALAALASGDRARATARHGGAHTDLYVVRAAGGKPVRLTANPDNAEDHLAFDPSWSPDGRRLVFTEVRCHSCTSEIHVVRARPVSGQWLGRSLAIGFHPVWSPDGRRIAYVGTNGGIYTVAPDGSHRRLLVKRGLADDNPSWSPDGKRIVFTEQETATRWRLYVMRSDGSGVHVLATGAAPAVDPAWSPTGTTIAFARQRGVWEIAAVPAGGGRVRVLSRGRASDSAPTWSPDGRRLAFVRQSGSATAIYVMNARSGRARRLTPPSLVQAVGPAWSPSGRTVAFAGGTGD